MTGEPTRSEREDLQLLLHVLTALAKGDFQHKMPEDQPGPTAEIARRVNTLVDRLNLFAAELTRISREVGTEGRFGGQMEIPGAEGTWRDMTDNVNLMAANLTNQVRNCVQVSRAYADGDFTRQVTVGCEGETRELKTALNEVGERLRAG